MTCSDVCIKKLPLLQMESDTSMITPLPNKSAQTFKRQIKCMIVWLIILSVFLAAMLAGQIVTVAYKV